jgi:hypothetical protein
MIHKPEEIVFEVNLGKQRCRYDDQEAESDRVFEYDGLKFIHAIFSFFLFCYLNLDLFPKQAKLRPAACREHVEVIY